VGRLYLALLAIATLLGCRSAGNKPCTGYAVGPRPSSFGPATLRWDTVLPRHAGAAAIIGAVADSETGRGLASATVILRADSTSPVVTFSNTDSLGGFVFPDVAPARYYLSAKARTYSERGVYVDAAANVIDTIRVALPFNARYLSCEVITTS
jgi:carboxypeptidase family protein